VLEKTGEFSIPSQPDIACIDFDLLSFPLIIRKWHKGDYFKPLGMNDFKKLSDYFIDTKISIPEKEKIWLVISEEKIVWVIGKRLDDRFKITPKTAKVMMLKLSIPEKD
jgi:tRNA(Ile)-lysidine synthase